MVPTGVRPLTIWLAPMLFFASGGRAVNPYVISHITDPDGKMLVDFRPRSKKEEAQSVD